MSYSNLVAQVLWLRACAHPLLCCIGWVERTIMHTLTAHHITCSGGVAPRQSSRPAAYCGGFTRPQSRRAILAEPACRVKLIGFHAPFVARAASNNGASAASEAVYIPVSELRELCEQSLAALGYTKTEIETLNEVRQHPWCHGVLLPLRRAAAARVCIRCGCPLVFGV